jgi:GNAT superfamily N-acetyltransferase
MSLHWVKEEPPRWDARKRDVFGADGPHVFGLGSPREGDILADEWWRAEDAGDVVGYGRLDSLWGDAEILVAVARERRGTGVASFVMERLEAEAGRRGLNYLYNTVSDSHPDAEHVTAWLHRRGFADAGTGDLRKRVSREHVS